MNVARQVAGRLWRVEPNISPGQTTAVLKGLQRAAAISCNRDMAWERLLEKKRAERLIAVDLRFVATADGFALAATEAVEPPVPYPEDTLSYLANVYNAHAAAFCARRGVKVIEPPTRATRNWARSA